MLGKAVRRPGRGTGHRLVHLGEKVEAELHLKRLRKSKTQGAEHPVVAGPVFGFTGELNPAARVTAEAEMDLPSPPFPTSDSGHPLLLKRHKGKVCYTKDMEQFSIEQEYPELIQAGRQDANW